MSAAINSVRREQTSVASSLLTVVMQSAGFRGCPFRKPRFSGGSFFTMLFTSSSLTTPSRLLSIGLNRQMQEVLIRAGHSPAEVISQGKVLFALWVTSRHPFPLRRRLCFSAAFADHRNPSRRFGSASHRAAAGGSNYGRRRWFSEKDWGAPLWAPNLGNNIGCPYN